MQEEEARARECILDAGWDIGDVGSAAYALGCEVFTRPPFGFAAFALVLIVLLCWFAMMRTE